MNSLLSSYLLPALPKLFEGAPGKVDPAILKNLFKTSPKPGKNIRALLNSYGIRCSPTDDVYLKLSEIIPSSDFREKWYTGIENKKFKIDKNLFFLAEAYLALKYENVGFDSPALTKFFEKRSVKGKERTFPVLGEISILTTQLELIAQSSPFDAALYAWSLIERTKWSAYSYPSEPSLVNFSRVLKENLTNEKHKEIQVLLEAPNWEDLESETVPLNPSVNSLQPSEKQIPERKEKLTTAAQQGLHWLQTDVKAMQPKIAEAVQQYEIQVATLISKTNDLSTSLSPNTSLDDIIVSIEAVKSFLRLIEDESKIVSEFFNKSISDEFSNIKLRLDCNDQKLLSPAQYDSWILKLEKNIERAVPILTILDSLNEKPKDVVNKITNKLSERTISIDDLPAYANELSVEVEIIENGLKAHKKFDSFIALNSSNFLWNPLIEKALTPADWQSLGELLIHEEEFSTLLGIVIRNEYSSLSKIFSVKLNQLIQNKKNNFRKVLSVFRCLSLGQIEKFDSQEKTIKPLLAIYELHAYLEVVSTPNNDAFVYWSASPLNQYATQPAIDPFSELFNLLFYKCGENSGQILGLGQFKANLIRARTEINPEGTGSPQDLLITQLEDILRSYKRGGNTYAELWSKAYAQILSPLNTKLGQRQLSEIVNDIEHLQQNFEIEDYLDSWKTAIPEHLRKRSEYDKQIRFQVSSKISELANWAISYNAFSSANKNSKDETDDADLIQVLRKVYESDDYNSCMLQSWFDALLNQQEDANPIPWCTSRLIDANLDLQINDIIKTALRPRSFFAQTPTFEDVLGDEIISSFGKNTAQTLAAAYAEQKLYETYFALSADSGDAISPDLDRRVEAEVDALEDAQLERILALQLDHQNLSLENEETHFYINDLNSHLAAHRWESLEKELSEQEKFVTILKSEKELKQAQDQLRSVIERLGGLAPVNSSMTDLESIHRKLLKDLAPRRKHIEPLKLFLNLKKNAPDIVQSAEGAIHKLEQNIPLPSANHSEYIAYVLEQAIQPLSEELKRRLTQLPSYSKKLTVLTLSLISHVKKVEFISNDSSPLLSLLEATAEQWKELPTMGENGIDTLMSEFQAYGLIAEKSIIDKKMEITKATVSFEESNASPTEKYHLTQSDSAITRFVEKLKAWELSKSKKTNFTAVSDEFFVKAVEERRWEDATLSAHALYAAPINSDSTRASDMLTNWALCMFRWDNSKFEDEDYATLFHLINRAPSSVSVRAILPTKNSKGIASDLVTKFFQRIVNSMNLNAEKSLVDQLLAVSKRISTHGQFRSMFEMAFSPTGGSDSLMLRSLWDNFSGDTRQAEARAELMNLFWRSSLSNALACCLTYAPIEIPRRKADALASIADQALVTGKFDLLQSFLDLRKTISAKPFQIFVNSMLMQAPMQIEQAAQLEIIGQLERTSGQGLSGILRITPRRNDCPDTIDLTFSALSPLRFADGTLGKKLIGPFIEQTLCPIEFTLVDKKASVFTVDITCSVISITGESSHYSTDLHIDLVNSTLFKRHSADALDDAFGGFPEYQMRGDEYVERRDDERKIEKSLFGSKTVRSLWISSPRRSGKTTMLYKILDSFSHKVGRDNVVVYLTLDESFDDNEDFNKWVWKRLRTTQANKELRDLYSNFDEIGKDLPWSADTGTFIGALADELMKATIRPNRVVFLIDEADKFASMYFFGNEKRETALNIMWQLRQLIGDRRDIGFVFAGSSAAKRIFVTNSDAPYFNGITLLELTPFSCKSVADEVSARAIVEPSRLPKIHTMPKESLEHLLWVCAGIPYYMKLVAGATFSIVKQSHILISDINDGLRALLSKSTGIPKLDDMSGDPGSDELRTMAIETGLEKILTLAVLYSVAEAHSPLGGHRLLRVNITSKDSPMVSRYRLTKKMIDRGLDLSIELGLLKVSADKIPEIDFAIPILGESIRHACGRLWSSIDHELDEIGSRGTTLND